MNFTNSCDSAFDSVDIRFTKYCDNACPFCIEKNGLPGFSMNVDRMAESTIGTNIKDVLVLGGEPFLYPQKLVEYIRLIRKSVSTIYVTTSLPRTLENEQSWDILQDIDGLNVSIQSCNWLENNKILNASDNFDRLELLRKLNEKFGEKIRTSINLVKGGVDTKEKLLKTLEYLQDIGCRHIKINELQHQRELYVSFEDIMGVTYASPYANGCSTEIFIEGISTKLTLKRSCFLVEDSRTASFVDLLKALYKRFFYKKQNNFKVIYENGQVENRWKTKEAR